jgi:sirohydrochlorin ferrochelatase
VRPGLLLAGHGAPRQPAAQAVVEAQATTLRRSRAYKEVACAFLSMPPGPAEVLAGFRSETVCVVPLFLSDGYFVRVALARALAAAAWPGRCLRQAVPVGLRREMTDLVARRATEACIRGGLTPSHCGLLLVAHGSARGSPASRQAAQAHVQVLASAACFAWVDAAFLEEPPGIIDRLAARAGDMVVIGLFAAPGSHSAEDVPQALAADPHLGERHVLYSGAIGTGRGMAGVIAAAACAALAPDRDA